MQPKQLHCAACAFVSIFLLFAPFQSRAQAAADLSDEPVVTHHAIRIHGKPLAYTARAGYLTLRDAQQRVRGRMFYVACTAEQAAEAKPRPLVFAWNGGPGSNAAMLQLGALGPKRLVFVRGAAQAPEVVDNDDTWLQFADLVFVDPIYAGYSYAATPEDQKQFLSDRGDAESFAEFIRLYQTHYQVQKQPAFIVGESYGAYRALGVASVLGKRDIPVRGMILLSTIFNFSQPDEFQSAFLLPNYTAAAVARGKLAPELAKDFEKTVHDSEQWAEQAYLAALVKGDRVGAAEKKDIAAQLARFTGVPADVWAQHDLRLDPDEFARQIADPKTGDYAGHYDTRATGHGNPGAPYEVTSDPSLQFGVSDAIVPYLRNELGWKSDALYAGPFGGRWPTPQTPRGDWTSVLWDREGQPENRTALLTAALDRDPHFEVLIANGAYDLATPFAATEYDVSQLNLSAEARARVKFVLYEGGHAAYTDAKVRNRFFADAKTLMEEAQVPAK
jgi:carboxypeptidase C (cathepsin A)